MTASFLTLLFVFIYMCLIIFIGWYAGENIEDSDDYLVAGRNKPTLLVTATLFATFWGGGTVLGGAGAAYHDGILGTIYDPFAAGLALILVGLFFSRILRKMEINSLDSLYRLRYGNKMSTLSSILMIPTYIFWTAVQIMAIGKVFASLLDLQYYTTAIIGGIIVIIYTAMGGMLAIAWTDFIQGTLILVGLIIMLPLAINEAGGYSNVISNVPQNFWDFIPKESNSMTWLSYISAWAGMALGNIPAPDIAQRSFIAKDEATAKKSAIGAGLMYWTFGFIPIFLGFTAITLTQQGVISSELIASDSEMIIPLISKAVFHPIPAAIFLGSLLSAVMSSADSSLFASSVILSNMIENLITKFEDDNKFSEKKRLILNKSIVVFLGTFSIIIGIYADSLYKLMIFSFSLLFGMLFAPIVFAVYWEKANEYGAIISCLSGALFIIIGSLTQGTLIPSPEWFYTLIPPLISIITMIIVSLLTQNICPPKPLKNKNGDNIKWGYLK